MLDLLIQGFQIVCQPELMVFIFVGIVGGVIFGALPGVSAAMGVALMVPFANTMGGVEGISFLVAVYCAAVTGGGITAILFRIPGTPANAPTTFDGYPMAQRGEAGKALGIALVCSAIGGLFSSVCMLLLSKQLSDIALEFGPAELFAVALMGLSVLSSLDSDKPLKTMMSGLMGLFLATIGLDPMYGQRRLTFGFTYLIGGVEMIPLMIGMFAVTEVLKRTAQDKSTYASPVDAKSTKTKFMSLKELISIKALILRNCVMGTIIGILPGAGATIAAFLGYVMEVKISKTPEKFGTGIIEGVAAAETANNAATGGSMIPLLALGIPGGTSAAIMASALMSKGVSIGPMLMQTQPQYLSGVFVSMLITNIVMVFVAVWIAKVFSKIMKLPYSTLGPIILSLAMVGSFALQNNTQNVTLMVVAGVVGVGFLKLGFSPAALVLGLVLGNICENNLRRAVILDKGSYTAVFTRPLTFALLLICILITLFPLVKGYIKSRKTA